MTLPPEFEARKRAALRRSAEATVRGRLREAGAEPVRFLTEAEEEAFLEATRPAIRYGIALLEPVIGWDAAVGRIAEWVRGWPEVAVWYSADTGAGGVVLSGPELAANLTGVVQAVRQEGNLMMTTPDGRSACVYFEEEYENLFAAWERGTGSMP